MVLNFKSKKSFLLLSIFFLIMQAYGQRTNGPRTKVFSMDMCNPISMNLDSCQTSKRLEVNNKELLSFGLRNTNHFRYSYKINSSPFSSFVDTSYETFTNSVRSNSIYSDDIFFKIDLFEEAPNKKVLKQLMELYKDSNVARLIQIIELIDTGTHNMKLNEFKKRLDSFGEKYFPDSSSSYSLKIDEPMVNMDLISKFNKSNFSNSITSNQIKSVQLHKVFQINPDYQNQLFFINKFIMRYEKLYVDYYIKIKSINCINNNLDSLNIYIDQLFQLRELLLDLRLLYNNNPIEDEFLANLFKIHWRYLEYVRNKFMELKKATSYNDVFQLPTTSNLKNYDLIRFEVERTDKFSNHTEKYAYDIYLKGGFKVDFSAGIFGTNLFNTEYSLLSSGDSAKIIREVNKGKTNIGFGGMVNIFLRTGARWVSPGISFGLILTNAQSFQLTSAFTLALGRSERMLLHYGVAMGTAKRIDINNYQLNTPISNSIVGNDVRTVDKFLVKPFFGLSYNLSKNGVFNPTNLNSQNGK